MPILDWEPLGRQLRVLGYDLYYPADAIEAALPDASTAISLLTSRAPGVWPWLQQAALGVCPDLDPRLLEAVALATARLGLRHGRLGSDFHAYHNELHIFEIIERRIPRLQANSGKRLPQRTWTLLLLFAACHDLRQREFAAHPADAIGANEAASVAETRRLLAACGLDDDEDPALFLQLDMAIAGSTFAILPGGGDNPLHGQGALARRLGPWLDSQQSDWRDLPALREAEHLSRLAADLDTANVGEDYPLLAGSAVRLVVEREFRLGRSLDTAESAQPCFDFLTRGQSYYLEQLHGFASAEGEATFGAQKQANARAIAVTSAAMVEAFAERPARHALDVIDRYVALTGAPPPPRP